MAENAPDELKTLAAEHGIDLESALQNDAAIFENMKDRLSGQAPKGPPRGLNISSSNESEDVLADENGNGIPDILEQNLEDGKD